MGFPPPPTPPSTSPPITPGGGDGRPSIRDLAGLRRTIERHFPVYDAQGGEHVAVFYVNVDRETVDAAFERLREELRAVGLVPVIRFEGGEHTIHVVEKPRRAYRSTKVNLVLFILTVVTTTLAGASMYFFYHHVDTSEITRADYWRMFFSPANLLGGFVTFALPLLAILVIHELGHYYMARRHNMEASLPFFIPLPPFLSVPDIGTLGAFISMREPIPNRKALLDIGAAGPIAGFIVAIPVLVLGMLLMKASPVLIADVADSALLGEPLLYSLMAQPFDFAENQAIHPTAFAGWVGLFVTGINLLPAGQLDGGHIAAALLGDKARYLSYAAVAVLLVLGFGVTALGIPAYGPWIMFALLIAFLGLSHPPTLNGVSGLDRTRVVYGVATLALLVVCFTPVPVTT